MKFLTSFNSPTVYDEEGNAQVTPARTSDLETPEVKDYSLRDQFEAAAFLGPLNPVARNLIQQQVTGGWGSNPAIDLVSWMAGRDDEEVKQSIEFQSNKEVMEGISQLDLPLSVIKQASSLDDLEVATRMYNLEKEYEKIVSDPNKNWLDVAANFGGYAADPTNLIPIGTLWGLSTKAATGALKAAGKASIATAGAVALSEAALVQPTSEIKTAEESAVEVILGAALGSVLGAGAGAYGANRTKAMAKLAAAEMANQPGVAAKMAKHNIDMVEAVEDVLINDGSLSAAKVKTWKDAGLEDFTDVPEIVARGLAAKGWWSNPVMYGMTRQSPTVKMLSQSMFNMNVRTNLTAKANQAAPDTLESLVFQFREKSFNENVTAIENMIYKANGVDPNGRLGTLQADLQQVVGTSKVKADDLYTQMQEYIDGSRRLEELPESIRGEMEAWHKYISAKLKEVHAEAKARNLVDWELRLNDAGLVTDVSRSWDIPKILAKEDDFMDLMKVGAERILRDKGYKYNKQTNNWELDGDIKNMNVLAYTMFRHITEGRGELDINVTKGKEKSPLTGFFRPQGTKNNPAPNKPRQVPLSNAEAKGFIKNDVLNNVVRPYEKLQEQVLAARWLEDMKKRGFLPEEVNTIDDLKLVVKEEYNEQIVLHQQRGDKKKVEKLQQEMNDVVGKDGWLDNSLELLLGNIKGNTGNPKMDEFFEWWLLGQVVNKLGRVTISSMPDMARVIVNHPAHNFMAKGTKAAIGAMFRNKDLRANKALLKKMGVSVDMTMNTLYRLMSTGEHARIQKSKGGVVRDLISRFFMSASGMAPWNGFWRGVSAQMSIDGTLTAGETLAQGGKLGEVDRLRLRGLGFTDEEAIDLYKAWKKNPNNTVYGGLKVLSEGGIPDIMLDKLARSIQKEIDNVVLIPGKGDIPIWAQKSNIGKVINQFQTFNQASTNRYLLPAIQDVAGMKGGNSAALRMGLTQMGWLSTAIGFGALSMDIKHRLSHNGEGRDWESTEDVLAYGLASSGVLGYIGSFGTTAYSSFTGKLADRYGDRDLFSLAGPSVGYLGDAAKTAAKVYQGQPIDRETAWRLQWFRNLDAVRMPADYMIDKLGVLPPKDSPEYKKARKEWLKEQLNKKKADKAYENYSTFNPLEFLLKDD